MSKNDENPPEILIVLDEKGKAKKKITDPDEIRNMIRKGTQIHFYDQKNILRPRGGEMEKESLSLSIYEKLESAFESWTDKKYGDALSRAGAIKQIEKNAKEEFETAMKAFKQKYRRRKR